MESPWDRWLSSDFKGRGIYQPALSPAENAIAHEMEASGEGSGTDMFADLAEFQGRLVAYLFADGRIDEWRAVARRLLCFSAAAYPATFLPYFSAIDDFPVGDAPEFPFPLRNLLDDLQPVKAPFLRILLAYTRPPEVLTRRPSRWIEKAAARFYLLARHYYPWSVGPGNLSYERIASIFGEIPTPPPGAPADWTPAGMTAAAYLKLHDRARSRWSARAQDLLARPIERVGGKAQALFGEKTNSQREACRRAALGNQNRRGGRSREMAAAD